MAHSPEQKLEVQHILANYFGHKNANGIFSIETLYRHEQSPKFFDEQVVEYRRRLKENPRLRERLYVDETKIIYLYGVRPSRDRLATPGELLYGDICSNEELPRIADPKTVQDELLRIRANAIITSTRRIRSVLRQLLRTGRSTLTELFNDRPFEVCRNHLPTEQRNLCSVVAAGFTFEPESNGYCLKTDLGNVIAVSQYLEWYLYFTGIYIRGLRRQEISKPDTFQALLIAGRIMMEKESWDFEDDPRAEVPKQLDTVLRTGVRDQIEFVIGHEYAHHYLGHLQKASFLPADSLAGHARDRAQLATYSHQLEYAADEASIVTGKHTRKKRERLLVAAVDFFLGLEVNRAFTDFFCPTTSFAISTHPDPLDRALHLIQKVGPQIGLQPSRFETDMDRARHIRRFVAEEYLPVHAAEVEGYGSFYLPDMRPRRTRIDRLDY